MMSLLETPYIHGINCDFPARNTVYTICNVCMSERTVLANPTTVNQCIAISQQEHSNTIQGLQGLQEKASVKACDC